MGATGPHFAARELACPHCNVNGVRQELVDALEFLRAQLQKPIVLNSAFRCEVYNRRVGGARRSQHVQGLAVDLGTWVYVRDVVRAQRFSGIGSSDNRAVHIDVRHLFPASNPTASATPARPARWSY